ncbi:MAG: glycosyltransferase family 39 protein [Bacteroidota bacterium]
MKQQHHKYIVLFIIVVCSFFFQFKSLNQFPQYKHSWAQSDRYALALGFLNNGGDFFHPETFIYNNQFPDDFRKIKDNTITSVDFPIHDYFVSMLMRIFNTTEPWCFRIYILLYSITGLFFLYRLTTLFTDSIFKSITVVLFAISSPAFLYYQAGFLPTIPSLANSMIALFFLFRYYKFNIKRDYLVAVLFLTLAVLARLPFAIILVALASMEVLFAIKARKIDFYKWLLIIGSVSLIGGYYLYNNHLRTEYGSIFLSHILPAKTFHDLLDYFLTSSERWGFVYFSPIHYILFLVTGIYVLIIYIFKKIKLTDMTKKLLLLASVLLFGCLLYYLLMTFQYLSHDYYFLDTFFLPIICLFLFFIIQLPPLKNRSLNVAVKYVIILVFIPVFVYSFGSLKTDRDAFLKEKTTADSFVNADAFLDSLRIPVSAMILAIGADGPNNPFVFMKRKGYAVILPNHRRIALALTWPFDYVVIENSRLINDIYAVYPNIYKELYRMATNGKITVFVRKSKKDIANLDDFFGLTNMDVKLSTRLNPDSISQEFSNYEFGYNTFSGKKSGIVKQNAEYGLGFKSNDMNYMNEGSSILRIHSLFGSDLALNECAFCVNVESKGESILFMTCDLKNFIKAKTWRNQDILFKLPQIEEKEFVLSAFIWNRGKNTLYYDNFEITVYQ